jgi:hypothetical protein
MPHSTTEHNHANFLSSRSLNTPQVVVRVLTNILHQLNLKIVKFVLGHSLLLVAWYDPLHIPLIDPGAGPTRQGWWIVHTLVIEPASWGAFPDPHGCVHTFIRALASYISWLVGRRIRFVVLTGCTCTTVREPKPWCKRLVDSA